ncbi:MAG: ABC transporter permease [Prevotellaceae bacterium]|nr:ABC transporter permease [Prevotellaceae bacterium]
MLRIQFLSFVRKEFYHVLRDKRTLMVLLGLPIVQILLFGFALTSEVKHAKILLLDNAKDVASQSLVTKISASSYFDIQQSVQSYDELEEAFKKGKGACALIIPYNFASDIQHGGGVRLQLIADGSDVNVSKTVVNYLTAITGDFVAAQHPTANLPMHISLNQHMLYNPEMSGSMSFIPGVMALILLILCTTLTAVSIVREKELGTMELLLVSPFKPILVILAKAIPYLTVSIVNFTVILLLSFFVLDMPIRGNLLLLYAEAVLFIIACLSIGLLISNLVKTQLAAMLISMMGTMLPTMIFSGIFFPVENMPILLQAFANLIPARWFYVVVKAVMLKGLGFSVVWKEALVMLGMTVGLLALSLKTFKVRLE